MRHDFPNDGFAFPMRAVPADTAAAWLERFEFYEGFLGLKGRPGILRLKAHLAFTFMFDLICNDALLDQLEPLLGPNILCVNSVIWIKNPRDGMVATWHQDVAYTAFDPPDALATWTAITPSTPETGCVHPRSHRWPRARQTARPQHALARPGHSHIDESQAVCGVLSQHFRSTILAPFTGRTKQYGRRRIGFWTPPARRLDRRAPIGTARSRPGSVRSLRSRAGAAVRSRSGLRRVLREGKRGLRRARPAAHVVFPSSVRATRRPRAAGESPRRHTAVRRGSSPT